MLSECKNISISLKMKYLLNMKPNNTKFQVVIRGSILDKHTLNQWHKLIFQEMKYLTFKTLFCSGSET